MAFIFYLKTYEIDAKPRADINEINFPPFKGI